MSEHNTDTRPIEWYTTAMRDCDNPALRLDLPSGPSLALARHPAFRGAWVAVCPPFFQFRVLVARTEGEAKAEALALLRHALYQAVDHVHEACGTAPKDCLDYLDAETAVAIWNALNVAALPHIAVSYAPGVLDRIVQMHEYLKKRLFG